MKPLRVRSVCLLAVILAGCAGLDSGPLVHFRDSAGIVIADNLAAAGHSAPRWTLVQPAASSIGVVEGDAALQLFRVAGATRLSDGRIAVLNSGTAEVRYFSPDGGHLASVGRRGEGPGEFVQPVGLARLEADSLLVWDGRAQRLTILRPEGRFASIARLERPALNPMLVGTLGGDRVVIADLLLDVPSRGFAVVSAAMTVYDLYGAFADSLGAFPWREIGLIGQPGAGRVGGRTFAPVTSATARGDRLWIATGAEASIAVHAADGPLRRIIRWDAGDRTVSSEHVERYIEDRCERATPDLCRDLRALPAAERFAATDQLVADARGNLWVKALRRPGDAGPDQWTVFDADGRLIATAETPERLHVLEIGDDWLIGVMRDELDVEMVELHAIAR